MFVCLFVCNDRILFHLVHALHGLIVGNAFNIVVLQYMEHMWGAYKRFNEFQQLYKPMEVALQGSFVHMRVL